jgi:hypothetical protein
MTRRQEQTLNEKSRRLHTRRLTLKRSRDGRLLRKQGVPCVLCWNTAVLDETARELVDEFRPPLWRISQARGAIRKRSLLP